MTTAQSDIQIGYPDFWPKVLDRYKTFCMFTQTLGALLDEVFSEGHREPLHKVCRHLAKSVTNSFSSVLLLGMNGFGADAIKIARTMFEASITTAYLHKHPEQVEDYLDFHFLIAKKRYRYMQKYAPISIAKLSPEAIRNSTDGYDRVVERFTDGRGRVRGRWSRKPFSEICAELGLEEHYLSFYALSSNLIHADFSGIAAQADEDPDVLDIEIAPSERFIGVAFQTAHFALVLSVAEYISVARPEKASLAQKLNNDFVAVWKKP